MYLGKGMSGHGVGIAEPYPVGARLEAAKKKNHANVSCQKGNVMVCSVC